MRNDEYRLVQEDYANDGWKVLVCSILLNRTRGEMVKPFAESFFEIWPTPEDVAAEKEIVLVDFLKPLGFATVKARNIQRLSEQWIVACPKSARDVAHLPGVGRYVLDAYRIFALGERNFVPEDVMLKFFLNKETIRNQLKRRYAS